MSDATTEKVVNAILFIVLTAALFASYAMGRGDGKLDTIGRPKEPPCGCRCAR